MERRPLQLRDLVEHRLHQQRQAPVAVAVRRPIVRRQQGLGCDRLDRPALRHQVRVVRGGKLGGQILLVQRLGVVDRDQMQVAIVDLVQPLQRLALDRDDRVDLALAQHVHRQPRLLIDQMRPDAEPFEHVDRGHEGGAVGQIDHHGLAVEVLHAADRLRRQNVHLLVEHLGHVDELVADVLGEVLAVEIGQRVLAHDPGVHTPQQQNVGDRLDGAAAHDRQDPQAGAAVERRGEIRADLGIGTAERTGHQAHGIGVELVRQVALGGGAVLEDRLEGIADGARIDAASHRAEVLPLAVGEAHHPHLLDRRMIQRAGIEQDARHHHGKLQPLQPAGLPHDVLARQIVAAVLQDLDESPADQIAEDGLAVGLAHARDVALHESAPLAERHVAGRRRVFALQPVCNRQRAFRILRTRRLKYGRV